MARPIKLSTFHHAAFMHARALDNTDPETAKAVRKDTWSALRDHFGIPENIKLKVELDDRSRTDYLILKDKESGGVLMCTDSDNYSHTMHVAEASVAPVPEVASGGQAPYRYLSIHKDDLFDALSQHFVEGEFDVDEVFRTDDFQLAMDGDTLLIRQR